MTRQGRATALVNSEQSEIRLLSGFCLIRRGSSVTIPTAVQRLVALLALQGTSSRLGVAGTLWPDVSDERADARLRTAIWRLKQACPDLIRPQQRDLRLAENVVVDVERFVGLTRLIVDQARSVPCDVGECLIPLEAGDLLPGWYDDWVVFERERLRQLRMHALERLSARWLTAGQHALAMEAALSAIQIEPLRESAHRAVISVHLAEGNLSEARKHYQMLRTLLLAELGVLPSPGLATSVGVDEVATPRAAPTRSSDGRRRPAGQR